MSTTRGLLGKHPVSGEWGLWFANPGYDCFTDDRTNRAKFAFSTNFADQVPFRVVKSGFIASNTTLQLPGTYAQMGGEPIFAYRPMVSGSTTKERRGGYYGYENDGAGNAGAYSEFYGFLRDGTGGNPAIAIIRNTQNQASTSFNFRYVVAIF